MFHAYFNKPAVSTCFVLFHIWTNQFSQHVFYCFIFEPAFSTYFVLFHIWANQLSQHVLYCFIFEQTSPLNMLCTTGKRDCNRNLESRNWFENGSLVLYSISKQFWWWWLAWLVAPSESPDSPVLHTVSLMSETKPFPSPREQDKEGMGSCRASCDTSRCFFVSIPTNN